MSLYANANANVNPLSYSENGLPVFSKDNGLFEENYYQSEKGAVVKDCTGSVMSEKGAVVKDCTGSVMSAENKENIEGGASLAFTFGTAMQEDPS